MLMHMYATSTKKLNRIGIVALAVKSIKVVVSVWFA